MVLGIYIYFISKVINKQGCPMDKGEKKYEIRMIHYFIEYPTLLYKLQSPLSKHIQGKLVT